MTVKLKTELFTEDNLGNKSIIYPFVESDHVLFDNGMTIENMIAQDVSTPTVVHDNQSFKVGVGDSDVSNSIVDSSIGSMTIKGQTYQNIIPDPSLRNKTSGNAMQKLNKGYDNVNVVDGVGKSAILSGQTLVNLVSGMNTVETNAVFKDGYITLTQKSYEYLACYITFAYTLTEGKKYLLVMDVKENTLGEIFRTTTNSCIASGKTIVPNGSTGNVKYIMTISGGDDLGRITLRTNTGDFSGSITFKPMLIEYQEGMENWDIPYFEGIQSVKMPVLSYIGKNLFDGEMLTDYMISDNGSASVANGNSASKNFTLLDKGTYVLSNDGVARNSEVFIYNLDKTLKGKLGLVNKITVTEPCYIKFYGGSVNRDKMMIEQGSTPTTYEAYKSNILSTPSDLVLRGISDIKDTLNVNIGEVVERIGEVSYDGSSDEGWELQSINEYGIASFKMKITYKSNGVSVCDKLIKQNTGIAVTTTEGYMMSSENILYIRILSSKADTVAKLRTLLSTNVLTFQYELATPVVKTVDLSSFGNWEKVVLNGSEAWRAYMGGVQDTTVTKCYSILANNLVSNWSSLVGLVTNSDIYRASYGTRLWSSNNLGLTNDSSQFVVRVNVEHGQSFDEWKQYLSQNPITVWYQTTTSQANSIKEMLSFSNGHIQLSSGTDNSLIPNIDYEVPTSNSYHLDLAKPSTKYTMKNMSGTLTIDGTSYNASVNGVFASPSAMTNKLMITSAIQSNAMLLEGDVTSKTIPYFKGVKSAFENEGKIEVLSTGKNLIDSNTLVDGGVNSTTGSFAEDPERKRTGYISLSGNQSYTITNVDSVFFYDNNKGYLGRSIVNGVTPSNCRYVVCRILKTSENPQLEIKTSRTSYEPYKSNDVKIPLLSPLRSLPNGVRDEIVLDRENNKAKIIQRIGKVVLNGGQEYTYESSLQRFYTPLNTLKKQKYYISSLLSDKGEIVNHYTGLLDDYTGVIGITGYPDNANNYPNSNWLYLKVKNITTIMELKQYLSQNPITVYYELAIPTVTEVDIEGYPYIFKDGHIFLNGEIAPITEIKYSVNQSHVIESQNSDLIRHEKETDYLYKLIGEYVRVSYESTLLTLNLELK